MIASRSDSYVLLVNHMAGRLGIWPGHPRNRDRSPGGSLRHSLTKERSSPARPGVHHSCGTMVLSGEQEIFLRQRRGIHARQHDHVAVAVADLGHFGTLGDVQRLEPAVQAAELDAVVAVPEIGDPVQTSVSDRKHEGVVAVQPFEAVIALAAYQRVVAPASVEHLIVIAFPVCVSPFWQSFVVSPAAF